MTEARRALLEYHERSKHRLDRYAPGPGRLDWANQPNPFREYEGAPRIELPLAVDALDTRYNDLRAGRFPAPRPFDLRNVAILFELSLGLSAWKSFGGSRWALRCNPSSGNLHPTEGYLVCPRLRDLPAGVYHYVSRDHVFEHRGQTTCPTWKNKWSVPGVVVGLSSIYWREAWKYGMRAWRYCAHDCGHAIAALAYAAAALGWQARMLHAPSDEMVATLLGLDRGADFGDAEREAPDVLVWIGEASAAPPLEEIVASMREASWSGRANRLSEEHVQWREIDAVHQVTWKPEAPIPADLDDLSLPPPADPREDIRFERIARQRRSAVDFDGVTSISANAFLAMLDCLLPRANTAPWNALQTTPLVHLGLMVHRVDGLEPGLYVFLRDASVLERMKASMRPEWLWKKVGPEHLPLFFLLPHDLRLAAKLVCCHQDIAADSCFALGMLAQFDVALREPWRYRNLFWECGVLGQVLYLEAEAAGIRATGIGCFFDDEMHALLGIPDHSWQSLYHFTMGGPVDDPRLTSMPPYQFQP